jgi:chromate reductase, NAD(P)H dehydrogenase (quinone)
LSTGEQGLQDKIKILGLIGSLRKGSFNKALMRAAIELAPENAEIEVFDLAEIPPFNQDWEQDPPQSIKDLKAKIRACNALLIATPEYNYSVPGVLKNAIDAASRPPSDKVFFGKPVAIMSASIGRLGGARAQYHLRQTFVFLNMYPVNKPEVMLSQAAQHIDAAGKLTDEDTRKLIRQLLEELINWTKKIKQPVSS